MDYDKLSKRVRIRDKKLKVIKREIVSGGDNELIDVTNKTHDAVACVECGNLHIVDEKVSETTHVTIIGNLYDTNGGLLGNADWDRHGVLTYHFCPNCLINFIKSKVGGGENDTVDLTVRHLPTSLYVNVKDVEYKTAINEIVNWMLNVKDSSLSEFSVYKGIHKDFRKGNLELADDIIVDNIAETYLKKVGG